MKFLNFVGESPALALKKAQIECGENALVVSTKQIQKKTINQNAQYEVTVVLEEEKPTTKKAVNPKLKAYMSSDDVVMNISEAAKQISQIAGIKTPQSVEKIPPKPNPEVKESTNKELLEINKKIAKLTDKLTTIQEMFWDEKSPNKSRLVIPPEFSQIYKLAYQSGMDAEHLNTIMQLTLEHMPNRMKSSTDTIKRYFQVLLRKMIPVRVEPSISKGQQKIMMLVGPTGVGKTTTLAKLAAKFAFLSEQKHRVGIITLDTYRLGAAEQLFQYAKMMKLPVEDVVDVHDFEKALHSLRHCDVVLIDTVGSSQYDKEKLTNISKFLEHSSYQIDVNLTLAAGTKLEDLKEIYNGFSFLQIDTIIITKFDETKMFGNVFSLIYDINKPLSYFSTGQEVPDDLKLATSEYLVECMLDGFKRAKNG